MSNQVDIDSVYQYDIFISHATEDKDFVEPLAHALRDAGWRVWYDDFELKVGDSLNEKINYGLTQSRFGIVVITTSFFSKDWTKHEMNGFVARQTSGEQFILPIWHRITKDELMEHAPSLVDIVALNSSTHNMEQIVDQISSRLRTIGVTSTSKADSRLLVQYSARTFGVFYVAPAYTDELPVGEEPEVSYFPFMDSQKRWISVVSDDEELEYHLDGTTLRIQVDWRNQWHGDEWQAHQLMSGDQAFALTVRPANGSQIYFPSVLNASRADSWMGRPSRSGWLVLEIQAT